MTNLTIKLFVGAIVGLVMLTAPAISAPIAGPKGILAPPVDNSQFVKSGPFAATAEVRFTEALQFTTEPRFIAAALC